MRILLVTPALPHPGAHHAGAKLVYHLLTSLSREHFVHVVSRVSPGEKSHIPSLEGIAGSLDTVDSAGPLVPGSIASLARTVSSYRLLARKAHAVLERERFDFCQVEFCETALFFSPPAGLPSFLSLHDVLAKPAWRRYENARGKARIPAWVGYGTRRVLEEYAVSKFRHVFTLSDVDREWAERLYPRGRFRVLRYPAGLEFIGLSRSEIHGRVLFVGALNRPQNVEAVRYLVDRVWPSVRDRCPEAELRVVGGGMADTFRQELERVPGVSPVGWVDRIEDEYASASIFAAPILSGGGIIVKILDAMAAGIPVVTTVFGNEGIGASPGGEVLVAEGPEAFANNICILLRDTEANRRIGKAGQSFVGERFGRENVADTVLEAYREIQRENIAKMYSG